MSNGSSIDTTSSSDNENGLFYEKELANIFKNAGIGIGGILISYAISYFTSVIATRVVGASFYGIYYLAETLFILCGFLASIGLFRGVLRYVSFYSGKDDHSRLKGTILLGIKITLISSLAVAVTIFGFGRLISEKLFHKPDLAVALRILIMTLPFSVLTGVFLSALQGLRLIKYHILTNNIIRPFTRLVILVFLFVIGLRFLGLVWAMALTVVITSLSSFYFLIRNCQCFKRQVKAVYENSAIVSFSLPLFLERFLSYLISSAPVLLLGYFMSSMDVGIYGIGVKLGQLVVLSLTSFNMIFAPTISFLYGGGEREALVSLFKTVTKWVFTIGFAVFLVLLLFGRPILSIFGRNFVAGFNALYLIALGQLFDASVGSSEYLLMMSGRPKFNLLNSGVLCGLTIAFSYILIPNHGIVGAALATVIAFAVVNVLRLAEVYHLERIHPYKRGFLKPLASGVLSALLVYILGKVFPYVDSLIFSICFGIVFIFLFVFLLRLFGFEREDRYILGLIQRKLRSVGVWL